GSPKDCSRAAPFRFGYGKALLQSFGLPVQSVGTSSEADWRSLVITEDCVYSLPVTGDTMLRRYQKCLQLLAPGDKA
ncbi:MAG: hypothetical protein ACLUQN_08365, partial [Megasphaera sp.]